MKLIRNEATKAIIPELRGSLGSIRYPCFAEIKWDGEATMISYDERWKENPIVCINKYGAMRYDWHKLDQIQSVLDAYDVRNANFLAELYYGDGKLGALYQLLSNKQNDDLNIKIYDIIFMHKRDGSELIGTTESLIDRKEILTDIFAPTPFLVNSKVMNSVLEVNDFFEDTCRKGYEGIVIKNFSSPLAVGPCDWVKMKKKDRTDYIVTSIDPVKERIEVLVPDPNKTLPGGIASGIKVGVKCPNRYKSSVKLGDLVTIEHQGVLDSGSLRHPVFIGKVGKEE